MILRSRNTNTMMRVAYSYMLNNGVYEHSRNGPVYSVQHPMVLCYQQPWEQVNFCPVRDANPFFHFMERIWFLRGIGDTEFICRYLPRMIEYSDDGQTFNAHYGYNARVAFGFDQLKAVAKLIREDPTTRQAVVQIWNPDDLTKKTKDKACNMQLVFRVIDHRLEMTVFNRSNDIVWGGVSGANITNLYVFQEYVAALAGYQPGKLWHVSNNWHIYVDNPKTKALLSRYYLNLDRYTTGEVIARNMVTNPLTFDPDLILFMDDLLNNGFKPVKRYYSNHWFSRVAAPLALAHYYYKEGDMPNALETCNDIFADDWRVACTSWLERRK